MSSVTGPGVPLPLDRQWVRPGSRTMGPPEELDKRLEVGHTEWFLFSFSCVRCHGFVSESVSVTCELTDELMRPLGAATAVGDTQAGAQRGYTARPGSLLLHTLQNFHDKKEHK